MVLVMTKYVGKTNFQPWEFPRSGRKKEREKKVNENNGQLRFHGSARTNKARPATCKSDNCGEMYEEPFV